LVFLALLGFGFTVCTNHRKIIKKGLMLDEERWGKK